MVTGVPEMVVVAVTETTKNPVNVTDPLRSNGRDRERANRRGFSEMKLGREDTYRS